MALTLSDQYKIATNAQKFEAFVIMGATRFALEWQDKIFDTEDNTDPQNPVPQNTLASAYLNRLHASFAKASNQDKDLFRALRVNLAALFANGVNSGDLPDISLSDFEATNLDQYIFSNIEFFEGALLTAFEKVSRISGKEKLEYDNLPA